MRADSPLVGTISPSPNFNDRRGKAVDSLILHYTGMETGAAARARLLDAQSQVSCHYLVWEDGRIEQLVAEAQRAWHAGRSYWAGETDMNAVSVGIEIVNSGHDGGCPPYPAIQIEAVIALCRDVCQRNVIGPRRVLAHSDIAPDRKQDPGEWFPWHLLARGGVGLWREPSDEQLDGPARADTTGPEALQLQQRLRAFGYGCDLTGILDKTTTDVVIAFQRHYRQSRTDGIVDLSTLITLEQLGLD